MTVLRDAGQIELECDRPRCGKGLGKAFDSDKFEEMISYARKKGWTVVKDGDQWAHYCPDHL